MRYSQYTHQSKLLKIGQAHLAPGMTLAKWKEILNRNNVINLSDTPEETLNSIIDEIKAVVMAAKQKCPTVISGEAGPVKG